MIPEYDRIQAEMANQRLECVRQQIIEPQPLNKERELRCPYCGENNKASTRALCCDMLRYAVATILFTQRSIDLMDRVDARREN